jgi:hypothetical protein
MLDKLRGLVTANRVIALIGLVGSAGAFLVAIQTSLIPGSPAAEAVAKAVVALGSVASFLKIVDRFLEGSQAWDALTAAQTDGKEVAKAGNARSLESPASTIDGFPVSPSIDRPADAPTVDVGQAGGDGQ